LLRILCIFQSITFYRQFVIVMPHSPLLSRIYYFLLHLHGVQQPTTFTNLKNIHYINIVPYPWNFINLRATWPENPMLPPFIHKWMVLCTKTHLKCHIGFDILAFWIIVWSSKTYFNFLMGCMNRYLKNVVELFK
jgi:hypothetical protein